MKVQMMCLGRADTRGRAQNAGGAASGPGRVLGQTRAAGLAAALRGRAQHEMVEEEDETSMRQSQMVLILPGLIRVRPTRPR